MLRDWSVMEGGRTADFSSGPERGVGKILFFHETKGGKRNVLSEKFSGTSVL